jgi:hypothetical protein
MPGPDNSQKTPLIGAIPRRPDALDGLNGARFTAKAANTGGTVKPVVARTARHRTENTRPIKIPTPCPRCIRA